MSVSTGGIIGIVGIIKNLADELCGGKLVFSLEGGYDLDALAASVQATFEVLLGKREIEDNIGPPASAPQIDISPLIKRIREIHGL
jgi:acetoin utilization deacetylase AcuC-like enzyme